MFNNNSEIMQNTKMEQTSQHGHSGASKHLRRRRRSSDHEKRLRRQRIHTLGLHSSLVTPWQQYIMNLL